MLTTTTSRHARSFLVAVIAGLVCTTAAHARLDDPNPLSGPKVKDTGVPGESKSFTTTESKLKYENRLISDRVFRQTIEYMRSSEVDAAVRLSDEQMKTVREEEQKLNTIRRDFITKNKETLTKLFADAGVKNPDLSTEKGVRQAMERARAAAEAMKVDKNKSEGKPEKKPAKDDGMMQSDPMAEDSKPGDGKAKPAPAGTQAAALQQLAEIRKNFPKSEDQHAAIWAVLTPEQQAVAQVKLKEFTSKESEQRMLPGVQNQVERQLKNDKFKKRADKKDIDKKDKK